eukprot:m.121333 g.121333  ORF g.121333 m.121333 type:complete len:78 (+) comp37750_c0_seq10:932-1165(+)
MLNFLFVCLKRHVTGRKHFCNMKSLCDVNVVDTSMKGLVQLSREDLFIRLVQYCSDQDCNYNTHVYPSIAIYMKNLN